MAGYVTKTGKDALGNEFSLQFWQNDDGSLQPVQRPVLGDGERMPVDIQGSDLSTLATDANLTTLIDKVSGDQATQTTLAAVLSELQSKADEATLASLLQELEKKADPSEDQAVTLSGRSIERFEMTTPLDAASLAPESTEYLNIDPEGAPLLLVAVSIDVTPWRVYTSAAPFSNTTSLLSESDESYEDQKPYLLMPLIGGAAVEVPRPGVAPDPATLPRTDLAQVSPFVFAVRNHSTTETGTVTVRVFKVWR